MATTLRLGPVAALLTMSLLVMPGAARAHAYPERADPKVGSTVSASPKQVRIWFDADLEPAFSSLSLHGPGGATVDDRDARVDPADPRLLEVHVPPLSPGVYRVTWSVVARDGHRTSGDYAFTVK